MYKKIKYGLLSNVFLAVSLILIVASFFLRDGNYYQQQIIFLAVAIYLSTSIAHHYFDKSLTFEIGLEYILIGALAFLVIFGIAI
jgi:hypothetical protein